MNPAIFKSAISGMNRRFKGTGRISGYPVTSRLKWVIPLFITAAILLLTTGVTQECLGADSQGVVFTGRDVPDDEGGRIILEWTAPEPWSPDRLEVIRIEPDGAEHLVGVIAPILRSTIDDDAFDGIEYTYFLRAWTGDDFIDIEIDSPVAASYQTFNKTKLLRTGTGCLIIFILFFFFVNQATRGKEVFIREIAGLSAVEEAVGRATEMGKPILFVPGTSYIEDVATIAGLNILGEITKKTAEYETPLIVPNIDPIVFTVAREIVKESYYSTGRPDSYNSDSVFFVANDQFAFVASVDGIMVREKPATNFFMGMFYAESLLLAETGAMTGAVQIAGSDSLAQLPFFITACDFTLIGEEFYAASAYISQNPQFLGAVKGQDAIKLVILLAIILGSVFALVTGIPVDRILGVI